MTNHSIILEKYKGRSSRVTCPSCGKKNEFTRYIDTNTGDYLSEDVGICNRVDNCGYHRTPKEYFDELKAKGIDTGSYSGTKKPYTPPIQKPISFFSEDTLIKSMNATETNNFVSFLENRFGTDKAAKLKNRFAVGTSKHWNGATVFWQIDNLNRIRTGKIMLYDTNTGKRIKEPFNHINWAQSVLKIDNFNLEQCLFGLHQIRCVDLDKTIAIVESEKTAIIAHAFMPQFCWLATGSKAGLSAKRLEPLFGRKVILYPDLNGFNEWSNKMLEIKKELSLNITISDLLEVNADDDDRKKGYDLADYLLSSE